MKIIKSDTFFRFDDEIWKMSRWYGICNDRTETRDYFINTKCLLQYRTQAHRAIFIIQKIKRTKYLFRSLEVHVEVECQNREYNFITKIKDVQFDYASHVYVCVCANALHVLFIIDSFDC